MNNRKSYNRFTKKKKMFSNLKPTCVSFFFNFLFIKTKISFQTLRTKYGMVGGGEEG